jgi:ABC-type uncharacterized transport system permease subunit
MSVSPGSAVTLGSLLHPSGEPWLALLVAIALAGYALAAALPATAQRWGGLALGGGLVAHALQLLADVGLFSTPMHGGVAGTRLGFAPVLSLTVCMVVVVHAVESRLLPLPRVRRALALAALAVLLLGLVFPGEVRQLGSRWAPWHWVLGVAAYGLFGAAVLHALLLDEAERRLRSRLKSPAAAAASAPTMPLLQLERVTFRFVQAGFGVLTAAIGLGLATAPSWRLDHKLVLSLTAWAIFAALIAGRQWRGWRGRHATRWLYAGTLVLLLAYAGTRFVAQVLLGPGG